jgi:hypothetical protein
MVISPVKAVVGGTHFPVKRNTIAQTCTRPMTGILASNPLKKSRLRTIATPALGPSFFCVLAEGVHVRQVLRALSGDAKIVRVRLEPN